MSQHPRRTQCRHGSPWRPDWAGALSCVDSVNFVTSCVHAPARPPRAPSWDGPHARHRARPYGLRRRRRESRSVAHGISSPHRLSCRPALRARGSDRAHVHPGTWRLPRRRRYAPPTPRRRARPSVFPRISHVRAVTMTYEEEASPPTSHRPAVPQPPAEMTQSSILEKRHLLSNLSSKVSHVAQVRWASRQPLPTTLPHTACLDGGGARVRGSRP